MAIVLAIVTKRVALSLFLGVVGGYWLLSGSLFGALSASFEAIGALFLKGWVVKTLLFALFVGAMIELMRRGGGVAGFVAFLERRKGLVRSAKEAELLAFFIGLVIFIESSITSLIAGSVARPLTDRYGTSREKLAYICDSTAAPVCTMFPLNAWGALLLGLIGAQIDEGVIAGSPLDLLVGALPYNFYAIFSILLVLYTILARIPFPATTPIDQEALSFRTDRGDLTALWLPILSLMLLVVATLFITGDGNPLKGSGSTAVFAGVMGSVAVTALYLLARKTLSPRETADAIATGLKTMVPVALILIMAFAIGDTTVKLGTGTYLAHFAHAILHPALLPAGIFLLSALIAFATGTSWGTFSIMMPIAVTMAAATPDTQAILPLAIAAVIGGGVFGDHASPISDTTIIASLAAGCDLIAHVKTQLPWALLAALLSLVGFLWMGWMKSGSSL